VHLLSAAGLTLPVGGTLGVAAGELLGGGGEGGVLAGLGELVAPEQRGRAAAKLGDPLAGRLGVAGRLPPPLLGLLAQAGGVGQQPRPVRWRVAEQVGEPVALGTQLALAQLPQIQPGGRIGRQPLGTVPAQPLGELLVNGPCRGWGSSSSTSRGSGPTTAYSMVSRLAREVCTCSRLPSSAPVTRTRARSTVSPWALWPVVA
jgi:hypothetical protein